MSGIQEKGTLPTQREPEFLAIRNTGVRQVENSAGGYSYVVDDIRLLERYIIIGSEAGTYYVTKEQLDQESVKCIGRLITKGKGVDAVNLIKDVSVSRRNIKQNCLLYALALCARSNDATTKSAAYSCLADVCRIPTHLFMFIKFCERESPQGTGWGRAHRRAVSDWYKSFKDKPEDLARLVVKYKNREGWCHRDVIRLSHVRCKTHTPLAFILRYIVKNYQAAYNMYLMEEDADVRTVADLMKAYEDAVHCKNVDQLRAMIREQNLTWEMVSTEMLRKKDIWLALLPKMPLEALVRNLGRMTSLGLFAENSEDEEIVLKKLQAINSDDAIMEVDQQTDGPVKERKTNIVHPFKLLVAWATYKKGTGDKGKLEWDPNSRIIEALTAAFYQAFSHVVPTNKKLFLAVDVSGSMSQHVLGSKSITCAMAAAFMLMQTVRTESDCVVKAFSGKLVDFPVSVSDTLDDIQQKTEAMPFGSTDCAQPMLHAIAEKMKDIDAFIVFTDSETCAETVHPTEALREYRENVSRGNVKLIVCGMTASDVTIADPSDPYMLDISGFDSAAPKLMSDFIMETI